MAQAVRGFHFISHAHHLISLASRSLHSAFLSALSSLCSPHSPLLSARSGSTAGNVLLMSPLRILAACFSLLIRPFNSTGRAEHRDGEGWRGDGCLEGRLYHAHWTGAGAGQHSLTKLHCLSLSCRRGRLMQNLLCEFVGLRAE